MRGGSPEPGLSLVLPSGAERCCARSLDPGLRRGRLFSKNRHGRFRDSDFLRQLFEATVQRCIFDGVWVAHAPHGQGLHGVRSDPGAVGGESFAVDANLIRAEANRQRCETGDKGLPASATTRAVTEYLAMLDDEVFGAATPVVPKYLSPVDPAAHYTSAHSGQAQFCYATNYLIDTDHAVIVDVEATTAVRQAEVTAAKRMIERADELHGIWPEKLIADTGYGSAEMLAWLVDEKGV
jgi:Transposase DDE domain